MTPRESGPPLFPLTRRSFVAGSAAFVAAALLSTSRAAGLVAPEPRFSSTPFTLGIASGDPLPDGVVLWTRLAPQPLTPDGGMGIDPVKVDWEVAGDDEFRRVVQRGTAVANVEWAHSVHVEVTGLNPDRWYWYRFKAGRETSGVGRTRTAPRPGATPDRLRFAFASCQRYENGYYTALDHLAQEDVDVIFHLGDYIYEGSHRKSDVSERSYDAHDCVSLADYRLRYARYKSDPALQRAHAVAPWILTWDDHEVSNNYAGGHDEHPERYPGDAFIHRRAAAYQAYFEHQPLRRTNLPSGPDMLLYRRLEFGRLATFHVLDTRQYRTVQPQGGGVKPDNPVLLDPTGTMMGDRQRTWLREGLVQSTGAWNVLAQQVLFARIDQSPGPEAAYSMDKWAGYEYERRGLLRHFREAKVRNPVVLSGDVHCNWANELVADFDDPQSSPVATEFVGTSITSDGDGGEKTAKSDGILAENPCVKFFNNERGYVRCELTPQAWRTDYRTVPYVTRPGAPIRTRATFHVESGRPHIVA